MKRIFVFLMVLISGCAIYPDRGEYESRLRSTSSSLQSFDQLEYTLLTPGETNKFELGDDGKVFDFGNGLSFYKGFSLPEIESKATVEVISLFNTFAQALGHVPFVTILVLNEDYEEVFRKESSMKPGSEWDGSTHFKDSFSISEEARSIIVYVDPGNIDKLIPWYYDAFHMGPIGEVFSHNSNARVGFGGPMKLKVNL